jgi:gamma-glutamylcyclotransferase (GGCT)/AIG2-like uncharacterized protein YtfP
MTDPVPDDIFTLFVYGTLKRGHENHARFCRGAIDAEEAIVRGRLYGLPFGFPALVVAEDTVHATGTSDPLQDATVHQRFNGPATEQPPDGPRVYGEVLTFDDAETRLPRFDHLEGFDPEGPSLYRRVLVPVETATRSLLAWAYTIERPAGDHLPGGRWPA